MSIGVIAAHAVAGPVLSAYASAVMADSPLGYYRMNENPSGPGATLVDSSGLGHNGQWLNLHTQVAGLVTGDSDGAINMAGGATGAAIAKAAWNEVGTITLEALLKPAAIGVLSFWDRDPDVGNRIFQFRMESGGQLGFIFWTNGGGPFFCTSPGSVFSSGVKIHVAATYDGTTARIYVNGSQVASTGQSGALRTGSSAQYQIGFNSGNAQRWNGVVDEFALYGTALSQPRIAAHAALV